VGGRARQASKGSVVLKEVWRAIEGGEVGAGRYMRVFGGFGDEMVGLCNEQHRIGLNRLPSAPLIGCGSYDLRSYMHCVRSRA
jgi:hypothetical protein